MNFRVSPKALKQLKKIPVHIKTKFEYWLDLVEFIGLLEARKYKGFHDEPLKGKLKGLRSVRLSKSYRVLYIEIKNNKYKTFEIEVIEVNKHEY